MITIKKTSWHYRMIAATCDSGYPPRSLCGYSSALVFTLFWALIAICGALALLGLLVGGPIQLWLGVFGVMELTHDEFAFGFIGQGIWVLVGLGWLITRFNKWMYSREPKTKQPSLIKAYIKAKKEKVCPVIEFVDENA